MLVNKSGKQQSSTPYNLSNESEVKNPSICLQEQNCVAVNDLRSKIISDYEVDNPVHFKCELLDSEISNVLDLPNLLSFSIKVSSSAAEIISSDALKYTLLYLNPKDLQITSLVSKFWGHASLEIAKEKEIASLKSFVSFLVNNLGNIDAGTKSNLIQLTENINLSDLKSLIAVKDLLLDRHKQILIHIKEPVLKKINICKMENLIKLVHLENKPIFFNNIIILAGIEVWIDLANQTSSVSMRINYLQMAIGLCCQMLDFERAIELANKMEFMKDHTLEAIQRKMVIAGKGGS